jgi:hypothetical protein
MKWLGSSLADTTSINSLYNKDGIGWQQWLSNNIGELLAVPSGCSSPDKERIVRTLKAFSRYAPRQSINGLAKWLGVPRGNMIY